MAASETGASEGVRAAGTHGGGKGRTVRRLTYNQVTII